LTAKREGNTIHVQDADNTYTITVSSAGHIVESVIKAPENRGVQTNAYHYRDGNLIRVNRLWTDSEGTSESVEEFKHDKRKSPLFHCNTPRWFLQLRFHLFGLNNNLTGWEWRSANWNINATFEYEYDRDGFPTKQIMTEKRDENHSRTVTTFKYRGATENRLANAAADHSEPSRPPQFDVYGGWEYVVSPSSFYEWRMAPPDIAINSDNTVSALFYSSRSNGVISWTDAFQVRVRILSVWAEGEEQEMEEGEEWTFIYDPITRLLKFGENYFRKKTEHEFRHEAWFNDEPFPMTVFYSPLADGGYNLDSLIFFYDNAVQAVRHQCAENPLLFWNNDPENFHMISLEDYNFDGYADISLHSARSGASNLRFDIFLYHPQSKSYHYHHELSEMENIWVDSETQTVKSHGKGGHAGAIYYFREYRWDDGQFALVNSENQDYDSDSERYIRVSRTLQNGDWIQRTDTIRVEDL